MNRWTANSRGVPLARRQLLREPLKLVLALLGVAVSVALVGLLFGLREGIGRQVTTYPDHAGADVYIASGGTRDFLSASSSSLPVPLARRLRSVSGVAEVEPITAWFDVVPMHGMKIVVQHIGFEPRRLGGPWDMLDGRGPTRPDEVAIDRVMGEQHGIGLGDRLRLAGRSLRVVGLTDQTSSWMAPLVFTTRQAAAAMRRRPDAATFFLVRRGNVAPQTLRHRLATAFPHLSVLTRAQIAANDRTLMASSFDSTLLVMVLTALGVGAVVIGITVYGFVSERRREFGTLKAMGARNLRLYWLVSRQALAIALGGLGLGVLLQRVTGDAIETLSPKFLFVYLPSHLELMVVAAFAMALFGALAPIRVLARLDPAEVFRR
ncbi:MAG: ABC transporter permease [Solirubrobacterales bacterium]